MRKKPVKPPEPIPVPYSYAFNTPDEVRVLVDYYSTLISGATSDEIIKYVDRIKFLEEQLRMPKASRY